MLHIHIELRWGGKDLNIKSNVDQAETWVVDFFLQPPPAHGITLTYNNTQTLVFPNHVFTLPVGAIVFWLCILCFDFCGKRLLLHLNVTTLANLNTKPEDYCSQRECVPESSKSNVKQRLRAHHAFTLIR